ncbi:NAD(P)-binding protein, partial [Algoriphagus aestuarii]|nr:NAD(P)-binding protein [Algoriphagus aestuarii]
GAGIAGLTAALAFATRGYPVTVFERAPRIEELGAGIQLSPNVTRLLQRLRVLDDLRHRSTSPQAIAIRSAKNLASLAEVPLSNAERRWGAPYLV